MKRIGILQTAFLGDTVLVAEMIGALKKLYKDEVSIHLIVKKGIEPIFDNDPRVSSISTFDKKDKEKGFWGLLRTIRKVRKLKLDTMLCVHRSTRSTIIARTCGAKKVIGFKSASMSFLFSKRAIRQGEHEVIKNHKLLEAMDERFKELQPNMADPYTLYPPKKTNRKDLSELEKNSFIVVSAGSRWETKKWTLEGYIELINRILKSYIYKVVLSGDKSDIKGSDAICSGLSSTKRVIDSTGKLNIQELFYLISKARLVVTNDSAPIHIAVGLKVPVLAIFGPTVKELGFYPYSKKAVVVENNNVACRPCGLHGHKKCPNETHECMKSITPIEVFEALENLL
ncbi:MAG TPA: glycosyltransferase family 9 protein [bacterium]|nr:glycosyltransferase family 9 protein [bacterium]